MNKILTSKNFKKDLVGLTNKYLASPKVTPTEIMGSFEIVKIGLFQAVEEDA